MKIESFNQELNRVHPGAYATVESNTKGNRQVSVTVWYSKDGKGYTYKGTVHAVAERLNLIPDICASVEAERVVGEFAKGADTVVGYAQAWDTLRQYPGMADVGMRFSAGRDGFDRDLVEYWHDAEGYARWHS